MAFGLGNVAKGMNDKIDLHQFNNDDVNKSIYAGQALGSTIERNREAARQQSVRNLIGQRMKEGYDWTQLGAEAAQFSPDMAQKMDNQFMNESKWNRQENEERLRVFRDEMTRRVFNQALENWRNKGGAVSREDFMLMCEEAATKVSLYNAPLAKELLTWIKSMLGEDMREETKRIKNDRNEFVKDHEIDHTFNSTIDKLNSIVADADKDPAGYAYKTIRLAASDRLQRWKNSNPYNAQNLDGRQLWSHMIPTLANYASQKFGDSLSGINGKVQATAAWLRGGISDDEINELFPKYAEIDTSEPSTNEDVEKVKNVGSLGSKNTSKKEEPSFVIPKNFMKRNEAGALVYSGTKGAQFEEAISNAKTKEDIKKLRKVIASSGQIKNDNVGVFDDFQKRIDAKEKEINGDIEKYGEDATPAFKKAIDKMLGSSRTVTSLNAQMTAFHNVVQTSDKTKSPKTIINSILLAQLPFYKPTDYDAKSAMEIKNASDSWEDMRSVIKKMGIPFFSELAGYENIDNALDAALQDFTRTFNGMYDTMVSGATEEEAKQIRTAAESRWNLNAKDWTILKNGRLKIGKLRQEAVKKADKDYSSFYTNDEGVNIDSKTGKPIEENNVHPSEKQNSVVSKVSLKELLDILQD